MCLRSGSNVTKHSSKSANKHHGWTRTYSLGKEKRSRGSRAPVVLTTQAVTPGFEPKTLIWLSYIDNYQLPPLNPFDFALQKAIQYQGYALAKERHLLLKQLLNRMAFQVEGRKVVRITHPCVLLHSLLLIIFSSHDPSECYHEHFVVTKKPKRFRKNYYIFRYKRRSSCSFWDFYLIFYFSSQDRTRN